MAMTQELAKFVLNMRYENAPEPVVNLAKMVICDFFGVAIAGRDWDGPRLLKDYVLERGGAEEAYALGHGFKTSLPFAALLAGTMGHVLDYDDVHGSMRGHGAIVIVPVIWAIGGKHNITGKRAIEAFLAGWETAAILGKYTSGSTSPGVRSWHSTKQLGTITAAMTAAKLLDLTEDQIRFAIGIAASMSGGLLANFGTMTKSLHAGICAHDGIEAALLAKKGFTSNPNVLEAEFGFRNAFVGGNPSPEEPIIEMMNNGQWDIATESLAFKMYPACYCGHCTIGAMIELSKRENINPEEVESICIEAEEFIFRILQVHNPKVGLEGKFCIEFMAAAALADRKVGLASFTDEKVKEMAPLMKKVTTRVSAKGSGGIMGTSATVEVKLKDGRLLTNTLSYPLGNANNPINWDQLFEKYRECVSLHYSSEDVSKSEKILRNLEQLDQFQRIVEIFSK
jgi:2-methylcitrate dehydratase PrpD